MITGNKVALNAIYLIISVNVVVAWFAPERCQQDDKLVSLASEPISNVPNTVTVSTAGGIDDLVRYQNSNLNTTYKNTNFFGVPIRGKALYAYDYEVYVPHDCAFYTHSPNLLSSVYCQAGVACKLSHTVSTVDSYTATEGHNWAVKVSTKFSLFEKIFEIGGEASTGGTYTCTYTKSRTKTDNVECSVPSEGARTLQLYSVRSDMQCEFGTVKMVQDDDRNGYSHAQAPSDFLTEKEKDEINLAKGRGVVKYIDDIGICLLDMDYISQGVLKKLKDVFPDYNPYTDCIYINSLSNKVDITYMKVGSAESGLKKVIPFTNEAGDSVFQYACIETPLR